MKKFLASRTFNFDFQIQTWMNGGKQFTGTIQVTATVNWPMSTPLSEMHLEAEGIRTLWKGIDVTELLDQIGFIEDDIAFEACKLSVAHWEGSCTKEDKLEYNFA